MKAILAILMILPLVSFADEPVIFTLDAENDSYTVPENCVLVVNAINNNITSLSTELVIFIGDRSCPWTVSFGGGDSVPSFNPHQTFPRPVRIPGGAVLTYLGGGFDEEATNTFFCTLERVSRGRVTAAGRHGSTPRKTR